ncbi:hypothetical protein D3C85_344800 [compost metagenome]
MNRKVCRAFHLANWNTFLIHNIAFIKVSQFLCSANALFNRVKLKLFDCTSTKSQCCISFKVVPVLTCCIVSGCKIVQSVAVVLLNYSILSARHFKDISPFSIKPQIAKHLEFNVFLTIKSFINQLFKRDSPTVYITLSISCATSSTIPFIFVVINFNQTTINFLIANSFRKIQVSLGIWSFTKIEKPIKAAAHNVKTLVQNKATALHNNWVCFRTINLVVVQYKQIIILFYDDCCLFFQFFNAIFFQKFYSLHINLLQFP